VVSAFAFGKPMTQGIQKESVGIDWTLLTEGEKKTLLRKLPTQFGNFFASRAVDSMKKIWNVSIKIYYFYWL